MEVAGRVPARCGHLLVLLARRKTTGEGARWAWVANWAGQVGFGGCEVGFFSLSAFPILVSVFYYSVVFRALLKILKQIQNHETAQCHCLEYNQQQTF